MLPESEHLIRLLIIEIGEVEIYSRLPVRLFAFGNERHG
jgi:hypothetical protein